MGDLRSEKQLVAHMIGLYCRKKHHRDKLCPECSELVGYTCARLDKCPFGNHKGTCKKCPVHCYRKDMREKIRTVMAFSGPRILFYHPVSYFSYFLKKFR
ncbi:MAG: nitrous oxide-stimulated promoter family protein [Candidatus Azobacteroides sp.]|nr:nitrous oxide-stimulated promoter family protein [Candidatus Azobacteroides sp.]